MFQLSEPPPLVFHRTQDRQFLVRQHRLERLELLSQDSLYFLGRLEKDFVVGNESGEEWKVKLQDMVMSASLFISK